MMGGVSPETCWASYKYGIIKFWYIVGSCWIFIYELYYDARIHEHQDSCWCFRTTYRDPPSRVKQTNLRCVKSWSAMISHTCRTWRRTEINPLNPELNPICYLLALLGAHYFLHVSRIRVKLLTFRQLMSYIYGAPILDVSRSHTTTQHSR